MSRKLIRQTAAQWRSNIWLVAELAIVSVAIWYMTDTLLMSYGIVNLPNGYDVTETFVARPVYSSESSPSFVAPPEGENVGAFQRQASAELMRRLASMPEVEAVGGGQSAMPYSYDFNGSVFHELDFNDSTTLCGFQRGMTPSMVDVLRLRSVDGATPEQLKAHLEGLGILVSHTVRQYGDEPVPVADIEELRGKRYFHGDSADVYTVGPIIETMRRSDYEPAYHGTIIYPLMPGYSRPSEIIVRVKPGMGQKFLERVRSDRQYTEANGVILPDFTAGEDVRDAVQSYFHAEERNRIVCVAFLMVSIFLGLLGTYWFRTQERVHEIAIRKVNGATAGSILARLEGEGMLLLGVATVIAVAVDALLTKGGLVEDIGQYVPGYGMWERLPVAAGITMVLMALMVALGILFPARRAMRVNPAVALHDE